jgi:hypothetical protein
VRSGVLPAARCPLLGRRIPMSGRGADPPADACRFGGPLLRSIRATARKHRNGTMIRWAIRWAALGGCLLVGTGLQAHHAVASIYNLNKEVVLQGRLEKLNFRNPHSNLILEVPNEDGTTTEWTLTTAATQVLTRAGVNRDSIKPGAILKITILPARNGDPVGFIRRLELGDQEFNF